MSLEKIKTAADEHDETYVIVRADQLAKGASVMSLEKIKTAADEHDETYVIVRADQLAKALADAGEQPTPGSLAEHAQLRKSEAEKRAKAEAKNNGVPFDPSQVEYPEMSVHRDAHLGKLLGVKKPPLET